MLKKPKYFIILGITALFTGVVKPVLSQEKPDSIAPASTLISDTTHLVADSIRIAINDSILQKKDSVNVDSAPSKKSKWDFLTTGGNDSTYYSFYGHLFNVPDTHIVRFWNYSQNVHELEVNSYDSSLVNLQINHPAYRNSINNSYLGNTGSAVNSNIFSEPNPETGFIFLKSFTPYMFLSKNMQYYNVEKPFTIFKVDMGPKEEQNLEILQTQNVNKYLNAFIRFKNYTGKGNFINQESRNNAGSIGGSYTQGRLASHINWDFNRIEVQENGGITDKFWIVDSAISPSEINVRLTGGSNYVKDRQLFFDQKIGFLKTNVPDSSALGAYWFSLQYTLNRQKSKRIYKDENDFYTNAIGDSLWLYQNNYNGGATFDSTYYFYRNNNFRINLEENPRSYPFVGAYFGYGTVYNDYYYFNKDTLNDKSKSHDLKSTYFEAGIYRLKGEKFKFSGNYKLFISGYRMADMQLDGFISQKFGRGLNQFELKGEGLVKIETCDYLLTHYNSNHYRWVNTFNPLKQSSFHFSLAYPRLKTRVGTHFNVLSDYIYFNNDAMPDQYQPAFTVLDVYAKSVLKFGPFGFNTQLYYQQTGNKEVLPLPLFSGYAALYWSPKVYFKDTGGHMRFHLGVDTYYWTEYYGPAYSPALATFHTQNEQLIGNYPFVGAFWNVEIKRLRFYLRYEHLNYGITQPANHFLAPNYTSNEATFRYGIVWTFYD